MVVLYNLSKTNRFIGYNSLFSAECVWQNISPALSKPVKKIVYGHQGNPSLCLQPTPSSPVKSHPPVTFANPPSTNNGMQRARHASGPENGRLVNGNQRADITKRPQKAISVPEAPKEFSWRFSQFCDRMWIGKAGKTRLVLSPQKGAKAVGCTWAWTGQFKVAGIRWSEELGKNDQKTIGIKLHDALRIRQQKTMAFRAKYCLSNSYYDPLHYAIIEND